MSKRKPTPFQVIAGKYDSEGENVKVAHSFETFAEAARMLDQVDDYPFARIELDAFSITADGYSPSFNDDVYHLTAGGAYPPNMPDPTLDYDIKARYLTSDLLTVMVVNDVDWIAMVHNGRKWRIDQTPRWSFDNERTP